MPNYGKSDIIIGNTANRATGAGGRWIGQGEVIASYEGPVPHQAVRDLIDWQPVEVPNANLIPVSLDEQFDTIVNGQAYKVLVREDYKGIVRSDNHASMGVFKDGYNSNGYGFYEERTRKAVGNAPTLAVGLLNGGRQFFIQYGMDESIHDGTTGVEFLPYLLFRSSLDGSIANTWDRGSLVAACDNMFPSISKASRLRGDQVKFKRSRFSEERMGNLESQLFIQAESTTNFVRDLSQVPVLRSQFLKVLDVEVPLPEADKASKAAVTRAENTRELLVDMYTNSPMVAPWKDTAFGVFQLFNTYRNREKTVRNSNRVDRVFESVLRGDTADADAGVLRTLGSVLERDLILV